MAVVAQITLRRVSREQYDGVRARAGWLDRTPAGELAHLTWWEGEDCHVVEGWESEDAFRSFEEHRLEPAMAALGLTERLDVRFHPAHEIHTPRRTVLAVAPVPETVDPLVLTRDAYDAFVRGDIPAVIDLLAPDIEWVTPDSIRFGGRYTGRSGVLEFFSFAQEHIREHHVEPLSFLDAGDAVVVLGRHRGRSRSGRACAVRWVHIWRWRDGRAIEFTECFDAAPVIAALEAPRRDLAGDPP
jgi:ketosteroid isomerase-like protein